MAAALGAGASMAANDPTLPGEKYKDARVAVREFAVTRDWIANPAEIKPDIIKGDGDAPARIKLVADPGACDAGDLRPSGFGAPLREGQVRELAELGLADSEGELLPAVFSRRASWDDGSLQWVWADFQGPVDSAYELRIRDGRAELPADGASVERRDGRLVVRTGVAEYEWDENYASPVAVRLGGVSSVDVAEGDGKGVYIVTDDNRKAVLGGAGSDLDFRLETENSLRAVLRIEGWYVTETGERMARAVVRYHFDAWRYPVRMEHRFVVTRDNNEISYREIAVRMPVAAAERATAWFPDRSGRRNEFAVGEAGKAYIYQRAYPLYEKREKAFEAGTEDGPVVSGEESAGWGAIRGGSCVLQLAVKDFAPQFPKELAADGGGLTAGLWANRDERVLDYRPATMAKDWWGEWIEHVTELWVKAATAPSPEGVKAMNPSCVGVARTHELMFAYYPPEVTDRELETEASCFEKPMVVQPDPAYLTHVDWRVLPAMAARSENSAEFEVIERGMDFFFHKLFLGRDRDFLYTGWYEWGKHPELQYRRAGAGGRKFARIWRLDNLNAYHLNLNLMLAWMRSARREYLEEAARLNRFLADVDYIHWSGGKDGKRMGLMPSGRGTMFNLPLYWAGEGVFTDSRSQESMTALVYDYFLRDNRQALDVAVMMKDAALAHFEGYESGETPDMTLMAFVALCRISGSPELLRKTREFAREMVDVSHEYGINPEFWAKVPGGFMYKAHRKIFALLSYYDLTQDPLIPPAVIRFSLPMYRRYGPPCTQPTQYQNRMGALASRLYGWTGDPDHMFWVRHQTGAIKEIFERLFALPDEELSDERESRVWVLRNVEFPSDNYSGKGRLSCNLDAAPAVFYSIPVALDRLLNMDDQ